MQIKMLNIKYFINLFLIFFCLVLIINPVYAQKTININGTNLKFVENEHKKYKLMIKNPDNSEYEVINKDYTINKKSKNNKTIYFAQNNTNIIFYSEDNLFASVLPKYYDSFKKIKFQNYPNAGTIKYKVEENNKAHSEYYTMMNLKNNFVNIKKFDKNERTLSSYKFNDANSIISMLLNISYSNLDNLGSFTNSNYAIPAYIDEDVQISNGNMYVTYRNIVTHLNINLNNYKKLTNKERNIHTCVISKKPDGAYSYMTNIENIQEHYNNIEKLTPFKFVDYPNDLMLRIYQSSDNQIIIFYENGIKTNVISDNYTDFYFADNNMFLNNVSYFNEYRGISFQNPNRIIAKKKDAKWGIIDKKNNIKVPFIYDKILPIGSNVNEEIVNLNDKNAKQLIVKYKGMRKDYNLFFAFKSGCIGVINDKNEIIVDFEPIQTMSDINNTLVKKSINKNAKNVNRTSAGEVLWNIGAIISIPLWLPIIAPLAIYLGAY